MEPQLSGDLTVDPVDGVGRPAAGHALAQMDLHLPRSGQDRPVGWRSVARHLGEPPVHLRLGEARDLDDSVGEALGGRTQPRQHRLLRDGPHFVRHARQQDDGDRAGRQQETGGSPQPVRQDFRPPGHHRLAPVLRRHRLGVPAESLLDTPEDARVLMKSQAEKTGDGLPRQVVDRRTETAGGDDQVGTLERDAEGGLDVLHDVPDDRAETHRDAALTQHPRQVGAVRVGAPGLEKLRTDSDQLGTPKAHAGTPSRRIASSISRANAASDSRPSPRRRSNRSGGPKRT